MEVLHCHGLKRPEKEIQVVGDKIDVISDIKEVTITDKKTNVSHTEFTYTRTRYSVAEFAALPKQGVDSERLTQLEEAFGELADIVLTGGNA